MESKDYQCSLLVVEDDSDLCAILRLVISKKCSVHFEHTLTTASAYLERVDPDVILLDNNLPDGYGVDSVKNILQKHPGAQIVLMTADTALGLREAALHEGVARFIPKPFKSSTVNDIIFSLCPIR